MSSESELESDDEFDKVINDKCQHNFEIGRHCLGIPVPTVEKALHKAIFNGRTDRVRRLLTFAPVPTTPVNVYKGVCPWTEAHPILEAAVRRDEEIFNMVWEKYEAGKSFFNEFTFAVTMASLFELELLRNALERKFPCLATSWNWNEPIMSAVEVISRPNEDRFAACPRNVVSSPIFRDLLTSFLQDGGPGRLSEKARVDKRQNSRIQLERITKLLKRFTSAVLAGDVAQVRKMIQNGGPNIFFRGVRNHFGFRCNNCQFNQQHFSCLDVLSSPFCLAIARNQINVFTELLSAIGECIAMDYYRFKDGRTLFTQYCGFGFDVALVQGNPFVIETLLRFFKRVEDHCFPESLELSLYAFEVISSREDLALSTAIRQNLTFDQDERRYIWRWYEEEVECVMRKNLRLRNRKISPLMFQFLPFEYGLDCILGNILAVRFKSALRSFLLMRQFKIPLQFLSTKVDLLSKWPEGVAMLIEDGLLVPKVHEVQSLRLSCRIAIREFLRQPIRESVKQLPLPQKVRKTLVFHNLPVYDFNHDLTPFTFNEKSERLSSECG